MLKLEDIVLSKKHECITMDRIKCTIHPVLKIVKRIWVDFVVVVKVFNKVLKFNLFLMEALEIAQLGKDYQSKVFKLIISQGQHVHSRVSNINILHPEIELLSVRMREGIRTAPSIRDMLH